jgi:hypothetical protein
MGTSALEILVVPVFSAVLGSCLTGAAILGLMSATEALASRMIRTARNLKAASRARAESLLKRGTSCPSS